jgi:hypothetical protein
LDRDSQRQAFFAYANSYLIDLKAAIVVDVEATRAIQQPNSGPPAQLSRVLRIASGSVPSFASDSAFRSAEMRGQLVYERALKTHVLAFEKLAKLALALAPMPA